MDAGTDVDVEALSESLVAEIFKALGLSGTGWARRALGPLFRKATRRLAQIGVAFGRLCEGEGFPKAAEWALAHWCRGIRARGTEEAPASGPLLVVSNHVGTYDALVIAAHLRRDDIRIFASNISFLMNLPRVSRYFFFLDPVDIQARMRQTRDGIRHLQKGGAILLYGSGQIDPDPAIAPDEAVRHVDRWSRSVDLFLRLVPETKVLLSVVSHAVSPGWARSPITWLRRQPLDKRRLAEFGQVLQQLFFPGSLYLSPRLSFSLPLAAAALRAESATGILPVLVAREKRLMAEHLAAFAAPGP